jgi:tetratricopeptide (TPR) repeat protein
MMASPHKIIEINNEPFQVFENEYIRVLHPEYTNLRILDLLGFHERIISLLHEISLIYPNKVNLYVNQLSHGGYIPIKSSSSFKNVHIRQNEHSPNLLANIKTHLSQPYNLSFMNNTFSSPLDLFHINWDCPDYNVLLSLDPNASQPNYIRYQLSNVSTSLIPHPNVYLYVHSSIHDSFQKHFTFYLKDNQILDYDNLLHLCIMVKNGGPQFKNMLEENMKYIDRWTILDTGSTDQTIETIHNTLVGQKTGELFQEPFVNFKVSRNRCLDLAGKSCKFIVMLDDTYILKGDLRKFLNIVRGDQFATSFTLFIRSDDTEYGSNRIIKSHSGLRYIHRIHEVITDKGNNNVVIPLEACHIFDGRFDYMEERTQKRKELDLKLLYEEVEENPCDPRAYYYLAQTYNLLENYEQAFFYFNKRCEFTNSGFIQERVDAAFEAARIANFKLNKPWNECIALYERAFKIDESRPEPLYFIGIHYFLENNISKAYPYFKKGFEIGYPSHCQYSLKPTLSFHFLPKFLVRCCFHSSIEDFKLGQQVAEFFLTNNPPTADDYQEILSYYKIFQKLNLYDPIPLQLTVNPFEKPLFVFLADGGFHSWSGSNIITSGVGGSETYIIEMARYIQKSNQFQVIVFCNCPKEEVFENVIYKHLDQYPSFVYQNYIHTCIISRFSEYLPLTCKGQTENVYLVLHDLGPSGNVIPIHPKLKNIFCLTEWHVTYFTQQFPSLAHLTVPFYYGIDVNRFLNKNNITKVPYKFIYSSFPNRGLLPLLQMWPSIYEKQPLASLHIFSDVNGKWVNDVAPDHMIEVRRLLDQYKHMNIVYHGWVNKQTLANAWHSADIWFYPCIFMETFCLTALEAAMTKTLVITNHLAALQNTVGDRGVIIQGDPMTSEWQNNALQQILHYMDPLHHSQKQFLIQRNYDWASSLTWENQANKLLSQYIPSPVLSLPSSSPSLLFLSLFDSQQISFSSFTLFLHSLYLYGNVDKNKIHLLIYTTTELKNKIQTSIPWIEYFTVYYSINDSFSSSSTFHPILDLFSLSLVNTSSYHTILYLDINHCINNDLNSVFELCKEDKLYAIMNVIDNEHNTLFKNDELEAIKDRTYFSSTILLFRNSTKMRKRFQDIRSHLFSSSSSSFSFNHFLNYHFMMNNDVDKYSLQSQYQFILSSDQINYKTKSIVFFNKNYDLSLTYFKTKKEKYIYNIIIKAKEIISYYLMPVIFRGEEFLEGCIFSKHLSNTISDYYIEKAFNLCDILLTNNCKTVLEIGFNAGFSSLLLLLINPYIQLTCIDNCSHQYTLPCFEIIKKLFPNRVQLINKNSRDALSLLINMEQKYDFIHIDGSHHYYDVFSDSLYSIQLSKKNTILIMDDYDQGHIHKIWDMVIQHYNLQSYPPLKVTNLHDIRIIP